MIHWRPSPTARQTPTRELPMRSRPLIHVLTLVTLLITVKASGDAKRQPGTSQRNLPKVQGSYTGAKPSARNGTGKAAAMKPRGVDAQRERPKVQGSYAGAKPAAQRTTSGLADRGRAKPQAQPRNKSKPSGKPARQTQQKPFANRSGGNSRSSALSGSNRGSNDRAASKRGRQSMNQRSSSKSHSKPQRKQRR